MTVLPEWTVREWVNAPGPLRLADLRGRVVVIHAFQMLCPGCVARGLPQAKRIREAFPDSDVAVVGLHTVFEHHAAMDADALRAFQHEYRWPFPIGIDTPSADGPVPRTMRDYGLRGTPSLIVLDRAGEVHLHHFGHVEDLVVGGVIGRLLASADHEASGEPPAAGTDARPGCDDDTCAT